MPSNAQLLVSRIQAWNKANPKASLDPAAVLAVSRQEGLGGGIGDQGTSFGPFQLHIGGAFPRGIKGDPQAWAWSPAGIDYALSRIASVAGGMQGAKAVTNIVSRFERPANPTREIAGALGALGQAPPGSVGYETSGSPQRQAASQRGSGGAAAIRAAVQNAPNTDALVALLLSRSFQPPPVDALGSIQNPAVHMETQTPPDMTDALTLARQFLDASKGAFTNPGFAQYVHGLAGTQLPSSTIGQSAFGRHTSSPKAGDVSFFGTPPTHQGVHLDASHILHSTDGGAVLRVSQLAHPAYLPGLTATRTY